MDKNKKKLGLIVNPIAGMGGKVALKGTDGEAVLAASIARGAKPESGSKAIVALSELLPFKKQLVIYTVSGDMGETICRKLGFEYEVVYRSSTVTTPEDTMTAAKTLASLGADLLIFAGGDGTARNIYDSVGERLPVIGIPAGVKIQSAVFALSPAYAGRLALRYLNGKGCILHRQEVADLDEDAYRMGRVSAALYGYLQVPCYTDYVQSMKQTGFNNDRDKLLSMARFIIDRMDDKPYAIGPGSTAKSIMEALELPYALLGVDVVENGRLVATDVTEEELWGFAQSGGLQIIVSPIGGQGFIFGRGNHQFSPRILRSVGRDRVIVMATDTKLISFGGKLHIDCGDDAVNESMRGYYNVVAGYKYYISIYCK